MGETSLSLLDNLRFNPDGQSWQRLFDIYSPMIRSWLARHEIQQNDVDDVAQNVLTVVFRKLPDFDRQRTGSFRRWLRGITANCLREYWRSQMAIPKATGNSALIEMLDQLEDPHSGVSRLWEEEHDRHVTNYLLAQLRHEFRSNTFQAFRMLVFDQLNADQVAAELGITVNAVFIAKSRVLKRLREIGAGLLETSEH